MSAQDWRPIATAPRDGTEIEVMADGDGPFVMRWDRAGTNPLVSREIGIWECPDGNFTWCEDDGFGPEWWRPVCAPTPLGPLLSERGER